MCQPKYCPALPPNPHSSLPYSYCISAIYTLHYREFSTHTRNPFPVFCYLSHNLTLKSVYEGPFQQNIFLLISPKNVVSQKIFHLPCLLPSVAHLTRTPLLYPIFEPHTISQIHLTVCNCISAVTSRIYIT
jgi:hypothetical protein